MAGGEVRGGADPLHLPSLARSSPGRPQWVPGTDLEVLWLDAPAPAGDAAGRWVVLLEGRLILDLPHRDFRILRVGDRLVAPPDLDGRWTPVAPSLLLLGPRATGG